MLASMRMAEAPQRIGAALIDRKAIASDLRARVSAEVRFLIRKHGLAPGLAVVLVGNDPASEVYVGAKRKMIAESGMRSIDHRLPASATREELPSLITALNRDSAVHRILVQLPLPPTLILSK